jgi:hypothetical protein
MDWPLIKTMCRDRRIPAVTGVAKKQYQFNKHGGGATMSITTSFRAALLLLIATFTHNVWAFTDTGDVLEVGNDLLIGNTAYGKRDYGPDSDTKEITRLGNSPGVRGELFAFAYTSTVLMEIGNRGEGSFSGVYGNLSTPRLVLGKEAGANGQIDIEFGNITGTGAGSTLIVGDAGTGGIQLGAAVDGSGVADTRRAGNRKRRHRY